MSDSREQDLDALRKAERASMIARLASHIAHELGTPLNVIQGWAKMIASGDTSPEETVRAAQTILAQTDRLTAVIKDFLSHTRKPSRATVVDIQDLCERAIALVETDAREANVEILFEPRRANVTVDPIRMLQVLTQLVQNAIHSMPKGGKVRVSITCEPVGDTHKVNHVFVSVRDEGVGIAKELIPNIFKPFTLDGAEGPKLGLPIAEWLVRESSGRIEVESEVGRGSLFTISLPEGGFIDAGTHSDRR